jgi:hypothetical protein
MPIDAATIAQMEQELEEARDQLLREDGRRYQIVMREISGEEKERIQGSLTDRHDRIGAGRGAASQKWRGSGLLPLWQGRPHRARLETAHRAKA